MRNNILVIIAVISCVLIIIGISWKVTEWSVYAGAERAQGTESREEIEQLKQRLDKLYRDFYGDCEQCHEGGL